MAAEKSEDKNKVREDRIAAAKKASLKEAAIRVKQADGEIGGPSGLEPTRYGDWERKGIVSDF
ncbi:MAG: DUF1674 domain-containing protein [Alphaproteobacteria bacterium]|nr:MAG: DUF1674 domain-containing protein [Alphaproteobacteria bacterium]